MKKGETLLAIGRAIQTWWFDLDNPVNKRLSLLREPSENQPHPLKTIFSSKEMPGNDPVLANYPEE